ncbi:prepilin-type N-terminal cleavage/methylation domain-containing protein [Algisphaera agarilytica]|uniref:Prepilin-type N-terminal cleavage/methylation domain-containing protein n=2 Tax=Algisphaera agarilytica TaxID=1385975 RepID=A0A7X0H5K1_9BACT|nr:prepilin-type N-terminal cleavage/methylation domain-containing protein [Algisphaera agarilytica]
MRNTGLETPSTRPGFTLIELLVVISLIALMMGLLLPILGKSRRAAMAGACLSNQRQLMVAIETYTIENKGNYPSRLPTTAAGAVYAQSEPTITYTQNGEELQGIELPPLKPARPKSWVAAANSKLHTISMSMTVYKQDYKRFYPRVDAPEFVCPADEDPVGPTYGGWMPDEAIDRSYVFNGFNDYKANSRNWVNQRDRWSLPQDLLTEPSATATLSEKKSGLSLAHHFHVDIFDEFDPVSILVQDRHDSGATHTFADGSAKLLEPYASSWPVNLWGITKAVRLEFNYQPDDLGYNLQ